MQASTRNILHVRSTTAKRRNLVISAALAALTLTSWPLQSMAASTGTQASRSAPTAQQRNLGQVLSPEARPFGYSLADMARLTADFNIGDRSGPQPNSPFQVLYENGVTGATDFSVAPGTYLYVPLLYNDNAPPLIGHFPANVENRSKVLRYWYSQSEFGVTAMQVTIDGKVQSLGAGHVSGVAFNRALPDGATQYLTAAAFVSPLSRGAHVVEIYIKATGDALREPPFDQYFPDGYWEYSAAFSVTVR
jgi:hypothetical protein